MNKTEGMPFLILREWNQDKKILDELFKLGYDIDTLVEDDPEHTELVTYDIDWCAWDYALKPGEETDPAVLSLSIDEITPGNKYYYEWLDKYYDCGTNKELFLALASLVYPNSAKNKWFVAGDYWEKTDDELPSHFMQLEGHRASFDEIVNYFKK